MSNSLLPPETCLFAHTFSSALAPRFDRERPHIQLIRTLWDPWTCPLEQLPLLAWAWSSAQRVFHVAWRKDWVM